MGPVMRERLFSCVSGVLLGLACLAWPARASSEDAAAFIKQMIDFVGSSVVECSQEVRDRHAGLETECATFGADFSSWKLKTDQLSRRHDVLGRAARDSAWTLRGGKYEREYDVVGTEVSVRFDAKTHLVVLAYEPGGDDVAEAETVVAEDGSGPRMAGFDGVGTPKLVRESRVEPAYPPEAKQEGIEGSVILDAVITVEGEVSQLSVLRCRPEGRGFEAAALEAVKQWRYEPAIYRGEPTDVTFTIYVEFALP